VEAAAISHDREVRGHRPRDPRGCVVVDAEVGTLVTGSDPLRQPVYAGDRYKPFGEFTIAEVPARANELRAASGFGPTARVGAIARVWSELAEAMKAVGAATVTDLGPEVARGFAARGWVLPRPLL
jgi:hypothetical protein